MLCELVLKRESSVALVVSLGELEPSPQSTDVPSLWGKKQNKSEAFTVIDIFKSSSLIKFVTKYL